MVVDPKSSLTPYRRGGLLKPNLREAEALSGIDGRRQLADLTARSVGRSVCSQDLGGGAVVVTRGSARA